MTIAYQATGTPANGTGAITVAWPAHQSGDFGILVCGCEAGETISLSTANGFVETSGSPKNGAFSHIALFWCRATSSSMASPVVADPGNNVVGAIVTFRGATGSPTPINAFTNGVDTTTSTLTIGGVTTTQNNCMIIAAVDTDLNTSNQYSNWANANLVSCTEWLDYGSSSGDNNHIAVAGGVKAVAGATGNITATGANNRDSSYIVLAIMSGGGGGLFLFSS